MERMICNEDMKTAFCLSSSDDDSHHDTLRSVPFGGGSGLIFMIPAGYRPGSGLLVRSYWYEIEAE
jgi:hypothetical protein